MVVSFSQTRIFPFKVILDFVLLLRYILPPRTDGHTLTKKWISCVDTSFVYDLREMGKRFLVFLGSFVKEYLFFCMVGTLTAHCFGGELCLLYSESLFTREL
ncbi:hypothetical protein BUQ74_20735 [Leptospira weilii serovar Heyan]|nr:hypothetical protein BUQ74_20735 [Leptospira weilii serovar Heyan]